MDDKALQHSPAGTLSVLPPELRFMIYALTLEPRVLEFELEGKGAQLRVCPRTAISFRYCPIIAHVCAEMRTFIFGKEEGESKYTPISFEYHILAASLGPDGFDVVERLVTGPSIAAAGVAADDLSERLDVSGGNGNNDKTDTDSEPSEPDDETMVFFDDYQGPEIAGKVGLQIQPKDASLSASTSITRGCITCFAGSSRRVVRGIFSPKIDRLIIRPYRLSRLNIVFSPVAPDLVYIENAPPIRLLSHRRTPLRSTFTRYLQAKADEIVAKYDERLLYGEDFSHIGTTAGQEGSVMANASAARRGPLLVEDQRTTSGRYEIITVPNEVTILREIPWVQLPRGRFHSLRR